MERLPHGVPPSSCRRAVVVRVRLFYTHICCWSLSRDWTGFGEVIHPRHPRALRDSETGPLLLEKEEEQDDAEGLMDQALAGLGLQDKEHMEGHWATRASRGTPRGTEVEGLIRKGNTDGGGTLCFLCTMCLMERLRLLRVHVSDCF